MLNHYARIIRPDIARPAARVADDGFIHAIAVATNTSPTLLHANLPLRAREQFFNTIPNSGSGCSSLVYLLPASYLGSVIDTLPRTAAYDSPVAQYFNDPSSWSRSTSPSLSSAASAWKTVTASPTFHDFAKDPSIAPAYSRLTTARESDSSSSDDAVPPAPDISLLSHAAGRHSQHFFATVLQSNAFHTLVNDHTLDLNVRSRIRQCSQEGAGRFMGVVAGRDAVKPTHC